MGNSYYVSITGNDSSIGSIASPWRTIQKGCDSLVAGDTLIIREGIYYEKITLKVSGNTNGYITITNYSGENVVIDGSQKVGLSIIDFNGQSFIIIKGLQINNLNQSKGYGLYMHNGESNIKIVNNEISNIKCTNPSTDGANAIAIYGENELKAINNILIENNNIHDLVCGWNEAVTITGNCEFIDIINNIITNTGNIGIDFAGNYGYCNNKQLDQARYCSAVGNIISVCNSPNATSYGLYVDGARDILLEKNTVFNCQGGIQVGAEQYTELYPVTNIIVRNNLVYSNKTFGVTIGAYAVGLGIVNNVKVYNNTIANNIGSYGSEIKLNIVDGLDFENNILFKDVSGNLVESYFDNSYTKNLIFKNNIYYSVLGRDSNIYSVFNTPINGFDNYVLAIDEQNAIFADPLFLNRLKGDYSLSSLSPAIDTGNEAVYSGQTDLVGNNRVIIKIDRGAYEYQGSFIPVEAVMLNILQTTIDIGATIQLVAIITPNNASNKNIIWTSSNEILASVTSNGLVTAKETGSAIITAKSTDGGKTATCIININKPININITIDGLLSDWANIKPLYCTSNLEIKCMRIINDKLNLYISVEGKNLTTAYTQFYIDTDNNFKTGFISPRWTQSGAEYLIENRWIYKYVGSGSNWAWTQIGTVNIVIRNNIELIFPLRLLGLQAGKTIHVGYSKNSVQCLPEVGKSISLVSYTIK